MLVLLDRILIGHSKHYISLEPTKLPINWTQTQKAHYRKINFTLSHPPSHLLWLEYTQTGFLCQSKKRSLAFKLNSSVCCGKTIPRHKHFGMNVTKYLQYRQHLLSQELFFFYHPSIHILVATKHTTKKKPN